MKKFAFTTVALACLGMGIASTASAVQLNDDGYYASGYFRWGTLNDSKGNAQWGPTWKRYTGSLSNEDNSWELTLGRHMAGYNGQWANVQATLKGDMGTNYKQSWNADGGWLWNTAQNWGDKNLYLDGAVVELGGFDDSSDASIWAGKGGVAKDNYDYLTDIFYTDYSGVGGGIRNLFDQFDIAYLQNVVEWDWNSDPVAQAQQQSTIHSLYGRYTYNDWKFDALYNFNSKQLIKTTPTTIGNAKQGFELTASYNMDSYFGLANGQSTVAVQWAQGLSSAWLSQNMIAPWKTKRDQSFRALAFGQTKVGNTTVLNQVWLTQDRVGDVSNYDTQNFLRGSAVVRAIYPLNNFMSAIGEVGGGFNRNTSNSNGSATTPTQTYSKIAAALQFGVATQPNGQYYPNIKLEAAYSGGNDIRNTIPTNNEWRFGIEAEINMPSPQNPFTGY